MFARFTQIGPKSKVGHCCPISKIRNDDTRPPSRGSQRVKRVDEGGRLLLGRKREMSGL
mgnify:CR=1 FL=1